LNEAIYGEATSSRFKAAGCRFSTPFPHLSHTFIIENKKVSCNNTIEVINFI
jgi:hypothetical protein